MDNTTREAVIMALLAHRIPESQICKYAEISKETFRDQYSYLDDFEFSITRNDAVENAIFAAATTGNTPSMIAWLKNKAGWDDGKSAAADQEITRHVPIEKIQIEVIANKKESPADEECIKVDSDGASS